MSGTHQPQEARLAHSVDPSLQTPSAFSGIGLVSVSGYLIGKQAAGKYEFRLINGGIDHNLAQEAPAFAKAVLDAEHL